jgi:hypothetical protein
VVLLNFQSAAMWMALKDKVLGRLARNIKDRLRLGAISGTCFIASVGWLVDKQLSGQHAAGDEARLVSKP